MALESISGQFKGLDMGQLIGAPLTATANASISLAQGTADFINKVGFNQDGSTRTALFKYTKKDTDKDGNLLNQEMGIDVPLLAIVPIPNLQVDEVNVLFDMEVKSSESSESSSDKSGSLKATAKIGYGPFSLSASVTGSISAHSANTRKSDNSAKYHVDVRATNHGTPEGLARVLDIMASCVAPSVTSQTPVDASGKPLVGASKDKFNNIKKRRDTIMQLEDKQKIYSEQYASCLNKVKKHNTDYMNSTNLTIEQAVSAATEDAKKTKLNEASTKITDGCSAFNTKVQDLIEASLTKVTLAKDGAVEACVTACLGGLYAYVATPADNSPYYSKLDASSNESTYTLLSNTLTQTCNVYVDYLKTQDSIDSENAELNKLKLS